MVLSKIIFYLLQDGYVLIWKFLLPRGSLAVIPIKYRCYSCRLDSQETARRFSDLLQLTGVLSYVGSAPVREQQHVPSMQSFGCRCVRSQLTLD